MKKEPVYEAMADGGATATFPYSPDGLVDAVKWAQACNGVVNLIWYENDSTCYKQAWWPGQPITTAATQKAVEKGEPQKGDPKENLLWEITAAKGAVGLCAPKEFFNLIFAYTRNAKVVEKLMSNADYQIRAMPASHYQMSAEERWLDRELNPLDMTFP